MRTRTDRGLWVWVRGVAVVLVLAAFGRALAAGEAPSFRRALVGMEVGPTTQSSAGIEDFTPRTALSPTR